MTLKFFHCQGLMALGENMLKKVLIGIGVFILVFVVIVGSRPSNFYYERSGLIQASAQKIFPYLNNWRLGLAWSPYERIDPNMKHAYSGPESGVGAIMEFAGNSNIGEGKLEILRSIPDSLVEIRLDMIKPFAGTNTVKYELKPEGDKTLFIWSMSGKANFISKLLGLFIDCEKMIGEEFEKGVANLKGVAEAKH